MKKLNRTMILMMSVALIEVIGPQAQAGQLYCAGASADGHRNTAGRYARGLELNRRRILALIGQSHPTIQDRLQRSGALATLQQGIEGHSIEAAANFRDNTLDVAQRISSEIPSYRQEISRQASAAANRGELECSESQSSCRSVSLTSAQDAGLQDITRRVRVMERQTRRLIHAERCVVQAEENSASVDELLADYSNPIEFQDTIAELSGNERSESLIALNIREQMQSALTSLDNVRRNAAFSDVSAAQVIADARDATRYSSPVAQPRTARGARDVAPSSTLK